MNLIAARLEPSDGGARSPRRRSACRADRLAGSRRAAGAVTLGIRPEDLYETAAARARGAVGALPGRVVAVEPLGAETLLVLALGEPGRS